MIVKSYEHVLLVSALDNVLRAQSYLAVAHERCEDLGLMKDSDVVDETTALIFEQISILQDYLRQTLARQS